MIGRLIVVEKKRSRFAFALHAMLEFIKRLNIATRVIISASQVKT